MALSYEAPAQYSLEFLLRGRGLVARHLYRSVERHEIETRAEPAEGEVFVVFCVIPLDEEPAPIWLSYRHHGETHTRLIRISGLDRERLESLMEIKPETESSWLAGYEALKEHGDVSRFSADMDRVLSALAEALEPLWRVMVDLPSTTKRLRLFSSGLWALVPFVALLEQNASNGLQHRFEIIHDAMAGTTSETDTVSPRLLVISDPESDLPHAREEGRQLVECFPNSVHLSESNAGKAQAISALSEPISHLHFSGHAHFEWRHPEKSGLQMTGSECLALDEILVLGESQPKELVVLSGCETGMTEYRELPDENYGLPLIFLLAGTRYVVAALWPVSDLSTTKLMVEFYRAIADGMTPPMALLQAQRWLRGATWEELGSHGGSSGGLRWTKLVDGKKRSADDRPFEHPFHWAGFACYSR